MHSIIIHLRTKNCLNSSSRLSLFPRLLTRPVDGSILCMAESHHCSSTRAPYENVIVLGHVQDENGQKMSKSKGNAVDPFDALQTYGADAIRWYFYINSAPWLPNRFHGKAVQEGQRKFMGTLWNTYAFFVLYANIDNFDATKYTLDKKSLTVMDRWILSKLNSTVGAVDDNLANYRIPEAAKALQEFVDDLSNWYVRRSRERFWAKGMEQDKINAYMTLYTALVTICKAAAPMIPFMTEEIYRNLVCSIDKTAPESIHLCDFPTVDDSDDRQRSGGFYGRSSGYRCYGPCCKKYC